MEGFSIVDIYETNYHRMTQRLVELVDDRELDLVESVNYPRNNRLTPI